MTEKKYPGRTAKEFIIWGVPDGSTDETILHTKSQTQEEARKVIQTLENCYRCTDCRIQILDISQPANFAKIFAQTIERSPRT